MRSRIALAVCLAGVVAVGGCGPGYAAIRSVHPPLGHRDVETRRTAYQFTEGGMIDVVLSRQWAAPGGEAVPDFEYVHLVLPQVPGEHRVGEMGTEVTRLVRVDREMLLYRATGGTVDYRYAWLTKDHVHVSFEVETRRLWPEAQGTLPRRRYHLAGSIKAPEDVRTAQSLINHYGPRVRRIESKLEDRPATESGAAGDAAP